MIKLPPRAAEMFRWLLHGTWRGTFHLEIDVDETRSGTHHRVTARTDAQINLARQSLIAHSGGVVEITWAGTPQAAINYNAIVTFASNLGGNPQVATTVVTSRTPVAGEGTEATLAINIPGKGSWTRTFAMDLGETETRTAKSFDGAVDSFDNTTLLGAANGKLPRKGSTVQDSELRYVDADYSDLGYPARTKLDMTGCVDEEFLWFDGVNLNLVELTAVKRVIQAWPAFSGLAGTAMSEANQRKPFAGPLPEGLYILIPQETLSQAQADSIWDWTKWTLKSPAWGLYMTEIHPLGDTRTWSRDSFYVHGGARPGSHGCIDLVGRNKSFHSWLTKKRSGNTLGASPRPLLAQYVDLAKKYPRTHATPDHCPQDGNRFCTQSPICEHNARYVGDGMREYLSQREALLEDLDKLAKVV